MGQIFRDIFTCMLIRSSFMFVGIDYRKELFIVIIPSQILYFIVGYIRELLI